MDKIEDMRVCNKCGKTKHVRLFYSLNSSFCMQCKIEANKLWAKQHRERARNIFKKFRKNNPEKYLKLQRMWRKRNIEKVRRKDRILKARQRKTPMGNLNSRMQSGIYSSIRGNKDGKKWESLVGYTVCDLMNHIQRKFIKGMNWDNMGEWHIDHIIPLSAFNFTSPKDMDFQKAWSLKNLRPLWEKDNLVKGAKLQKPFQPALLI